MKPKLFSILLTFLLCSTLFLPISIAQDYTIKGLPEGATKRLGKGAINEIAYSPDGSQLAVASSIGIWMYDAQTGEELNLFTGHTGSVSSVSFSPDGQTLAGGSKQEIRLWNVSTGDVVRTLTGHTSLVRSVSFSPDGQTLASADGSGSIRLWNVSTGDLLNTLIGHWNSVLSVSFSPDGQMLASGSSDGTVLLWALTPASTPEPEKLAADVNGDGTVNIQDLVWVAGAFGQQVPEEGDPADVNGDGKVNIQDLVAVAAAFGEMAAGAPAAANLSAP